MTPVHVGDQIEIDVQGKPQKLTVSGFARTRGRPSSALLQRALAYMSENDLEALFQTRGVNNFLFQLRDYGQRDATARQLAQVFAGQHVLVLGVSVGHSDYVSSIADGLFGTMRVLSIIALLLSVFLLLGTIMALVAEQAAGDWHHESYRGRPGPGDAPLSLYRPGLRHCRYRDRVDRRSAGWLPAGKLLRQSAYPGYRNTLYSAFSAARKSRYRHRRATAGRLPCPFISARASPFTRP